MNHQMEVSRRFVVCFLFCVLVCGVHSTTLDVIIGHNEHFDNGLELRCTDKDLFLLTIYTPPSQDTTGQFHGNR